MATRDITSAEFDALVATEPIVLIDFWAEWCGPCRAFAPVYQQAAEKYGDRITFAKVDTEAEREIAMRAQITSIPTLMAFRDGICVFAQPGALPAPALQQVIDAVLALDMDDVRAQIAAQGEAEIDIDELAARHAAGGFVLDVREDYEYEGGRVPGVVHIPMNEVPARLDELPAGTPISVICQSGSRSQGVTAFLRDRGFDAVNVAGGTAAWAARGWPIER